MFLNFMEEFYTKYSISTPIQVTISIALIFLVAFLLTRITKLIGLPNVTAYMFTGIILGPYLLNMIPEIVSNGMSFISSAGLGIIGFSCGRYFNLNIIRKNGIKPVIISVIQTVLTCVIIMAFMLIFKFDITICVLLGIVGAATSSSSTIMTIRQYDYKGKFVDYLIELLALNNIIVLIAFSICIGICETRFSSASFNVFNQVVLPILVNVGMIIIGVLLGILLAKVLIRPSRSKDNRLILTVASLLILVSLCGLVSVINSSLNCSPLLASMVFGATYINLSKDEKLFSQTNSFCAPILLIFFVLSGMSLQFKYFASIGVAGLVFFIVSGISKYASTFAGAKIVKTESNLVKYGGICLFPCAGVAVGLANIISSTFTNLNLTDLANQLSTMIIASSVLFEIIGPALVKLSLAKSVSPETLKKKERVYASSSMLEDVEVHEIDEKVIERKKELLSLQDDLEKSNLYIHTQEYHDSLKKED